MAAGENPSSIRSADRRAGPIPSEFGLRFSATDVWITSRGGQLARWDGTTQTATICNPDPFVINKIWGENPNSIWAVGLGGRIGHYANGTWQRVESGTSVTLNDVWGGSNRRLGQDVVVVAASNKFDPGKRDLCVSTQGAWLIRSRGQCKTGGYIRFGLIVEEMCTLLVGGVPVQGSRRVA